MSSLMIEHRSRTGSVKRWKLSARQEHYSYGRSKEADLTINDPEISGIQGAFEFRKETGWVYIDLQTAKETDAAETPLTIAGEVAFSNGSAIHFRPLEIREGRMDNIFGHALTARPGTSPYHVFIHVHAGHVLEMRFYPEKRAHMNEWMESSQDNILLRQRTIHLTPTEFAGFQQNLPHEEGSQTKRVVLFTLFFATVLGALFLFSPSREFQEVTQMELAPHEIITKLPPPTLTPKQKAPEPEAPAAAANSNAASKAQTALSNAGVKSNALTAFSQSRISKLLGKLSVSPAHSVNAMTSVGKSADAGPSGTALSRVGNELRSGQDWSKEGQGNIHGASTVGKNGNVGGMGQIGNGKAGTGGVNISDDGTEVVGGLDREVIAQYVRSQLGQILYCYERALSANPELFGKVAVNFIIGGTGQVETQTIKENTLKNAGVEGCMLDRISHWKFPTPKGGTRVVVTYPFLFKSTN